MKRDTYRLTWLPILLLVVPLTFGCQEKDGKAGQSSPDLLEQNDRIAYSTGQRIGQELLDEGLDLNIDALRQGIRDGIEGSEPLMSDEEIEQVRRTFREKRLTARRGLAEERLAEEKEFLQENAEKEGVVELPSGLQYRVLEPGDGEKPAPDDNVKVHYRGYFIDGTEFENTYEQNQPAVFPVQGVVPGWTEALQLMKEGAKWELFIPSKLAYGKQGAGEIIGPNKTLIFEIELIEIH